ncbi:MAG: hypothetical protein AAGI03_18245 [Pseudomonadota bacterium]
MIRLMAITTLCASLSGPALAYIGPGVGAGAMAAVVAVFASLAVAFLALLWYPAKRLLRGGKRSQPMVSASGQEDASEPNARSQ